ncbi:unnamed protein product [Linum trigynum]|uniref:Reverse transcriptase zinc-binding domain-containing protein n=1 Tax=Linum trigynum TaxID=586398 RepID=A0AAV2ETG4_9ROSI
MYGTLSKLKCPGVSDFPSASVWRKLIPAKISFFIWTVAHGKILMVDMLQKHGWSLANRCELCYRDAETADHLFTSCSFTQQVWSLIMRSCNKIIFRFSGNIGSIIKDWQRDVPDCLDGWFYYCALNAVSWFI